MNRFSLCALLPLACFAAPAVAWDGESRLDTVQVTATRFGEQVQAVPQSMNVITAAELRARGATDLRTALALLAGAGIAPGGDAGPAGTVPGLMGMREVDDFLLLIDGVPAGGAFTPPFEIVSLGNVERIEVLRGAAPVYFGTIAFAGTINIIHYAAGRADNTLTLSAGSHGSWALRGAKALSDGPVKHSLAIDLSRHRVDGAHVGYERAQAAYRLETRIAEGRARLDLNLQHLRQYPGSPTPVEDGALRSDVPVDFNQNPADARLDTQRHQLVLGYDKPLSLGDWGTMLSLAHTRFDGIRGFLLDDGLDLAGDNAEGAHQRRQLHDLFVDTHLTSRPATGWDLTIGINDLHGRASQSSDSFGYRVSADGSPVPDSSAATPGDASSLADRRDAVGLYAQSRVVLTQDTSLLAGLRWNRTSETRRTTENGTMLLDESQRHTRLSGSLGAQWQAWRDSSGDLDDAMLYASIGNTFQPPQLDFGVDAVSQPLLRPETQRSLALGAKLDGADGRFDMDISAFVVDFANQPVAQQGDDGPVLVSGGTQRFKGIELETSYRPAAALTLSAHASYTEARYRRFSTLTDSGLAVLDGRLLPMTPRERAGAGISFAPDTGLGFSLTANYAGRRYLDSQNMAAVGGFTVFDGALSYRTPAATVSVQLNNLGNRRDAIVASELGEGQFYRMQGRRTFLSVTVPMP